MITSKFAIGQQVRHKLLGTLGVVVDVDPEYSLSSVTLEEINLNNSLRYAPWYHVVIEDEEGKTIHTYLAEAQLEYEIKKADTTSSSLDEFAESIRYQLQSPHLRH